MDKTIVVDTINGASLAYQQVGSGPPIVLVAGASSPMDWWDDEFCELLAAGDDSGPRRVVRYDLRDTGQSVTVPLGAADYTGTDLEHDLAALVEHLDAAPAHLVGLSLGGALVQRLALDRPELVASIILISTSPIGGGGRLPPPTDRLAASFETAPERADWHDPVAVGDAFVATERQFSGSIPVDEARIRRIAARAASRTTSPESSENHWTLDNGVDLRTDIASIDAPALVVHGSEDPMFPLEHGEKLAQLIAGARLVVVPGMGHQYPPPATWPQIIAEVLRHTARVEQRGSMAATLKTHTLDGTFT